MSSFSVESIFAFLLGTISESLPGDIASNALYYAYKHELNANVRERILLVRRGYI